AHIFRRKRKVLPTSGPSSRAIKSNCQVIWNFDEEVVPLSINTNLYLLPYDVSRRSCCCFIWPCCLVTDKTSLPCTCIPRPYGYTGLRFVSERTAWEASRPWLADFGTEALRQKLTKYLHHIYSQ